MRLRQRLGISEKNQQRLTQVMQLVLTAMAVISIYTLNFKMLFNSLLPLFITFLPALLERDLDSSMDTGLVLWITSAAFLHGLGSLGVYGYISWFDQLTHFLAATVVAGTGYAAVRAIDEHADGIELPARTTFIFVLIFTIAFGVIWEVLEFLLGRLARFYGGESVLLQHGVNDAMQDLLFNLGGGLVVATWGHLYLTDAVQFMADLLGIRSS
ncbi:MAG: hypothetical protein SV186_03490 [Candidatus Nanohaloarchaea archaeon]|nr:hypothetical protein [Candidatus Nanohaloarchaea archaeon]